MTDSRRYVATIGFFDGVHNGHRYLIRQVCDEALSRGLASLVVTFPEHPRSVLVPSSRVCLLSLPEEKRERLLSAGVDKVAMMSFTRELGRLSPFEFMDMLRDDYGVEALVVGYDHHFGHGSQYGFEDYRSYGERHGIDVVKALELSDMRCSSTAVREALERGDVESASRMLGYDYTLTGRVVRGFHLGTGLGFPTANLEADERKLVPANGVYAVLADGQPAMLNIGVRPTMDNGAAVSVEAHILDFSGDLYGKSMTLTFLKRLRDEIRFPDTQSLRGQLMDDERYCRRFFEK